MNLHQQALVWVEKEDAHTPFRRRHPPLLQGNTLRCPGGGPSNFLAEGRLGHTSFLDGPHPLMDPVDTEMIPHPTFGGDGPPRF